MGEFYFIFNVGFNDQTSSESEQFPKIALYSEQYLKGPIFICFCCQPLKTITLPIFSKFVQISFNFRAFSLRKFGSPKITSS